jgi:uncharacterized protein YbjT (DUF2867 family)
VSELRDTTQYSRHQQQKLADMAPIKRVVLVGATGNLGPSILKALIDADFDVTVFTRPTSSPDLPTNVKVVKVDYSDTSALTAALQGQDALISNIAFPGIPLQRNLLDASIAAGVQHFIPSEFGADISHPKVQALPIFRPKIDFEAYLSTATAGTKTTYTLIYTNGFLDWGVMAPINLLADFPNKRIQILDGGDTPSTNNTLAVIRQAVIGVLRNPEAVANRAVRVNGAVVTQNQLLSYAQKAVGKEGWDITYASSEDLEKEAWRLWETDRDGGGYVLPFIQRAIFGRELGGNYDGKDDNEVLGVRKMGDGEVEEMVRDLLAK